MNKRIFLALLAAGFVGATIMPGIAAAREAESRGREFKIRREHQNDVNHNGLHHGQIFIFNGQKIVRNINQQNRINQLKNRINRIEDRQENRLERIKDKQENRLKRIENRQDARIDRLKQRLHNVSHR